jgi:hypothetical protein
MRNSDFLGSANQCFSAKIRSDCRVSRVVLKRLKPMNARLGERGGCSGVVRVVEICEQAVAIAKSTHDQFSFKSV